MDAFLSNSACICGGIPVVVTSGGGGAEEAPRLDARLELAEAETVSLLEAGFGAGGWGLVAVDDVEVDVLVEGAAFERGGGGGPDVEVREDDVVVRDEPGAEDLVVLGVVVELEVLAAGVVVAESVTLRVEAVGPSLERRVCLGAGADEEDEVEDWRKGLAAGRVLDVRSAEGAECLLLGAMGVL
ncbi:hypothetical protein AA313_de0208527 [Arthrobotrys entomopaga]|nr:hypothetical protein AA313_de0208527 [Arthrobotrys entomopaga]